MTATLPEKTFSIAELNNAIGGVLEAGFPEPLWVTGEIQGYDRDASRARNRRWGQVYFELAEKETASDSVKATVRAMVWGDSLRRLTEKLSNAQSGLVLQDGLKVRFLCAVDFYVPRASLQLKVMDVDPRFTLGDLERARQELIDRLKKEGLFDKNKALEWPLVPQRLGLITSEGSAAYHDFVQELKASPYAFKIKFMDARMQGEGTEDGVCRALRVFSRGYEKVDVVVLIRGGGSRSDLMWFDKESMARAVAECRVPVVTGIGHEIDLSVTDLVAHESFKTPTAVAQALVGSLNQFEERVQGTGTKIMAGVREAVREAREDLRHKAQYWRQATQLLIERHRHGLKSQSQQLRQNSRQCLLRWKEKLAGMAREVHLKDPVHLLKRGYSLLWIGDRLVKSVKNLQKGESVEAQLHDGRFTAAITKIKESR